MQRAFIVLGGGHHSTPLEAVPCLSGQMLSSLCPLVVVHDGRCSKPCRNHCRTLRLPTHGYSQAWTVLERLDSSGLLSGKCWRFLHHCNAKSGLVIVTRPFSGYEPVECSLNCAAFFRHQFADACDFEGPGLDDHAGADSHRDDKTRRVLT